MYKLFLYQIPFFNYAWLLNIVYYFIDILQSLQPNLINAVYIDEMQWGRFFLEVNDLSIIELYWARDESAIDETDKKYGNYCRKIANNILQNQEDSEECVNDTYLKTWNSIPMISQISFQHTWEKSPAI